MKKSISDSHSGIRAKGLHSIQASSDTKNSKKISRVYHRRLWKRNTAKKMLNRAKFHGFRSSIAPRIRFAGHGAPLVDKNSMEPGSQRDLSHVRCYRCYHLGHFAFACPCKSSNFGFSIEPTPKDIDFIVKESEGGNWNDIWYVNPSFKRHQTNNQTLFSDLKYVYKIEKDSYNDLVFIHGLGRVKLFVNGRYRKIPYVRYVPNSKKNILSEEQLIIQGYDVRYEGNYCVITKTFMDNNIGETIENSFYGKLKEVENPHPIYSLRFHQQDANRMFEHLEDSKKKGNQIKTNWDMCVMFLNMIQVHNMFNKHKNYLKREFHDLVKWFVEDFQNSKDKEFPPKLGDGKTVDLLDCYMSVHLLGGFKKVTQNQKWTDLAVSLGFRIDQGSDLQLVYFRYLNTLEWYYQTITKRGYFEDKDLVELVDNICITSDDEDSSKPLPIKIGNTYYEVGSFSNQVKDQSSKNVLFG